MNQGLNLSFDITLSRQKSKTIDISATGVYFELITNNMDAFASNERKLNLSGEGLIIREDIKESSIAGRRLFIAVQLTEKLNVDLGLT